MFIGKYNRSLIITYIGVIFTIIGIEFALNKDLKITMMCLVISGICDMFDGKVARMCKRDESEKSYGIQIDSLADTICFVVFPIIIGYSLGLNKWYSIIGYCLLALAGITRLGFFNITAIDSNKDKPVKQYNGLPVTSTAIIFPFFWFLSNLINGIAFDKIYVYLTYIVAFLFVFNFKIRKPSGKRFIVLGILAALGLLAVILI